MKKIVYLLFFISISITIPLSSFSSEYYTLHEFYNEYPQQHTVGNLFQNIVLATGSPVEKGRQKHPVKIAFVYPGQQESDYWRRSILSFTRRMDEIGLEYEISEYFTKANIELRKQEKQLQLALSEDPDYLVYTLNVMRHRNVIERILTKGKPKLILQNITTPLRDWKGIQPFFYVGFDHRVGTVEHLAQKLIEHTDRKGDYAVLFFDQGYISTMRGDSMIQYLEEHSDLNLVASYYTNGQRDKAKAAALEIIRENNVKFIYACSTDIALGVIDALQETGKIGEIGVNGWGGGSSELVAIQQGLMDFTVMRMNDDNGVAMAEAIRFDVVGQGTRVPTVYSGSFEIVDKKTEAERVNALKKRAFRYSGVGE